MNNTMPHSKMAARTHHKGIKPLPEDGWRSEYRDGPWKDYVERCVCKGALVYVIDDVDYIVWRNDNGRIHRKDGPAIERAARFKAWWFNGKCHRMDGPAVEHPDGSVCFFKEG